MSTEERGSGAERTSQGQGPGHQTDPLTRHRHQPQARKTTDATGTLLLHSPCVWGTREFFLTEPPRIPGPTARPRVRPRSLSPWPVASFSTPGSPTLPAHLITSWPCSRPFMAPFCLLTKVHIPQPRPKHPPPRVTLSLALPEPGSPGSWPERTRFCVPPYKLPPPFEMVEIHHCCPGQSPAVSHLPTSPAGSSLLPSRPALPTAAATGHVWLPGI